MDDLVSLGILECLEFRESKVIVERGVKVVPRDKRARKEEI